MKNPSMPFQTLTVNPPNPSLGTHNNAYQTIWVEVPDGVSSAGTVSGTVQYTPTVGSSSSSENKKIEVMKDKGVIWSYRNLHELDVQKLHIELRKDAEKVFENKKCGDRLEWGISYIVKGSHGNSCHFVLVYEDQHGRHEFPDPTLQVSGQEGP